MKYLLIALFVLLSGCAPATAMYGVTAYNASCYSGGVLVYRGLVHPSAVGGEHVFIEHETNLKILLPLEMCVLVETK